MLNSFFAIIEKTVTAAKNTPPIISVAKSLLIFCISRIKGGLMEPWIKKINKDSPPKVLTILEREEGCWWVSFDLPYKSKTSIIIADPDNDQAHL